MNSKKLFEYYINKNKIKKIGNWNNDKFLKYDNILDYKDFYKKAPSSIKLSQNNNPTNSVYQVLIYAFADGNSDGIGDFIGLKSKINYFKKLGIDQILLSPIHSSSSYHSYDVINYCDIAPQYGTLEDFIAFLNEAHKNGIKVYLDMIFNHTSYEHPWFQKALAGEEKYRQFYRFNDDNQNYGDLKSNSKVITNLYKNIPNKIMNNDKYIGRFWEGMPDLNLDNFQVIEQLIEVQKYWTKIGVDGFRYDAISEYYISVGETCKNVKEAEFFYLLRQASEEVRKEMGWNNDIFMVGEWLQSYYRGLKYHKFEDKYAISTIYDGMRAFYKNPIFEFNWVEIRDMLQIHNQSSSIFEYMNLLNNHDTERWFQVYKKYLENNKKNFNFQWKIDKKMIENFKNALTYLMFSPGKSIIYHGDELGYHSSQEFFQDPGFREPINWENEEENCALIEIKDKKRESYVYLNVSKDMGTVEQQINDEKSIFNHLVFLNNLRKKFTFIGSSSWKTVENPELIIDLIKPSYWDLRNIIVRCNEQKTKFIVAAYTSAANPSLKFKFKEEWFKYKIIHKYKVTNRSKIFSANSNGSRIIFEVVPR
ncbi:alpha-amylase family glycosyl hydrolase [Mycoplasma phocimorsus]|uniref:alpha-amylase family glycosyl hydrolase n=1 Tax=Mycoplasma phocimorsus TaxID=3045839 RepID=UPI0024BF3B42|nr:alpha-amylase family glycosyl hydrolase [Mycoplasma phocimorsus]MDJ1648316.1 alpha-amylase family glycosyl hydrolase [Mycoplasma phocimorsus]